MPEEEIEKNAEELDKEPVPGLGDAPGDDDDDKPEGYVCMPADLVAE